MSSEWLDRWFPFKASLVGQKKSLPEGVWAQCTGCGGTLYQAQLKKDLYVCNLCDKHLRIPARARVLSLLDQGSANEIATDMVSVDNLKFKKYKESLAKAKRNSGENSALLVFEGALSTKPVVVAAFEFSFIGGSMGYVVGEKFVQGVERSIALNAPFICFCASGGARMQEGLMSLMQMAKTSAALTKLSEHGLPYISVLTDPTTGGVSASFAMLGDIIIAEPKALIGFAGPRVIEQTVRQKLPEGFQSSEFLLQHGSIDLIVNRKDMRQVLTKLVSTMMYGYVAEKVS